MRIRRIFVVTAIAVTIALLGGCASATERTTVASTPAPQVTYAGKAVDNSNADVIRSCNRQPGSGVLLSFDDFGTPDQVTSILDALRKYDAQAAFFPTGDWALKNLALIDKMKSEGHIVGNHTQTHARLGVLSAKNPDGFYAETFPLDGVANTDPMWLRPPYGDGAFDERVQDRLTEKGVQMCTWTADTYDWSGDTVKQMMHRLTVGDKFSPEPLAADGVVLMHMSSDHAAEMVGMIVTYLESKDIKVAPMAG